MKGEPTLQVFLTEAKVETQGYLANLVGNNQDYPDCVQNVAPGKFNLFSSLRKLILKIRSSEKLLQMLHLHQKENSIRQTEPILNTKAHWNSTYTMLKWAVENKKAIEKIATKEEKGTLEWDLFKQLVLLLEAFDSTTSLVCPSKSCSLSSGLISMIDTSKLLNDQLTSISNEHQLYWPLKQAQEKIQKYFSFYLSDIYLIAIVLDPAYKLYYFEHYVPELYLKADQAIKNIFQEFQSEQLNGPAQETYVPVAVTKREKFVLNQKRQQSQKNLGELALYLNTEVTSTYILLFWKENAVKYPTLSKIARHIFACQATSGASEQEFNGAVDIFGVKKGHMLAETFSQLKETQTILKNDYEIKIV
ncbi:hypothetical protein DSO57_1039630 [Entomophthora muscae]|nr:hypothetical protein DSO57_1039630 [Entomophthora muscae]